jgi:amino acid adenylation domain-containing protein
MTLSQFLSNTGTEKLTPDDIQLLQKWNAATPTPVNMCTHELVREVCLEQPEAIAISASDGQWTYAEIDSFSSALARRLIRLGVGAGVFVPICIEKSCWVIIGMMAVLKAGGAFLLLDRSHPPDRLLGVCQDISATVVLASASCFHLATILAETALVISENVSTVDNDDFSMKFYVQSQSPMYAVFTSGSTGKPKGAVVSHSAFTSMATEVLPSLGINRQSRVLQFSSNAFDAILSDYWITLLAGGCVCIPSESEIQNRLSPYINELNINWALLTPSVARILSPEQVPTIQHLAIGGEAILQCDIDMWSPHVRLIGMYGLAECAVFSAVQPDMSKAISPSSLNHLLAVNGWVVDPQDHNMLLPVGEEGELLLEGPCLGDGYVNQPELTAMAFIESPAWLDMSGQKRSGNGRMYKTGDLFRLNSDGVLQYRGRKGTQVKLRGQRIELGEVESVARECCPEARGIVAEVVRRNHGQLVNLCLFLHYAQDQGTDERGAESSTIFERPTTRFQDQADQLLLQLRERLPRYMVPEYVLPINYIPRNTSSKTNRRLLREKAAEALQEFHAAQKGRSSPRGCPTTEMEKRLHGLCATILKVPSENIGIDDNWFHIGGNSVLTMQLVGNATKESLLFAVQDVYRHPVLSDLAGVIQYVSASSETVKPFTLLSGDAAVQQTMIQEVVEKYPDSPDDVEDIYPCTTNQIQCIQLSVANDANLTIQIDLEPVTGSLDLDQLAHAWSILIDAHPILRTHIVELEQGDYFQVVRKGCIPIEHSSSWPTVDMDIWGLGQPLLRLIRQDDRFMMIFHHALHDSFSLALVLRDFERAYRGEILQLQPFSPFIQCTLEINSHVDEFWKSMFSGWRSAVFPSLPHPEYKPRGACYRGRTLAKQQQGLNEFMIDTRIRLALGLAVAKVTGNLDVVFGAHVNRRDLPLPGITQMTGPTIGTYPVRLQFSSLEQTLRDHLMLIQNQTVETIPFQCAELDYIKRLSPEAASACEFQTSLMVQANLDDMVPFPFSQCRYREAPFECWSLGFVVETHPSSLDLHAFYDEKMIETSEVDCMLDLMSEVLELIDRAPGSRIGHLLEV